MRTRVPPGLEVAADVSAAEWLTTRLWPWPTSDNHVLVGSIVPEGFSAYAAVRHETGDEDDLSDRESRALAAVLTEFTSSADQCWFCIWTGYGDMDPRGADYATVRTPGREYLLHRGPLGAITKFPYEPPQIWWPSDRTWCVGSDMDLARTFIGGPEECIDALAARNELDVERVTLDVRVDGTNDLARLVERR